MPKIFDDKTQSNDWGDIASLILLYLKKYCFKYKILMLEMNVQFWNKTIKYTNVSYWVGIKDDLLSWNSIKPLVKTHQLIRCSARSLAMPSEDNVRSSKLWKSSQEKNLERILTANLNIRKHKVSMLVEYGFNEEAPQWEKDWFHNEFYDIAIQYGSK